MNKTNLLVDTGIFLAILIAMEPHFTGIAIHEWLSLALAGAIVAHLLLHWKWIVGIATKFFQKLWHTSRLKFVIDALLFVDFVTVMLSGIMISRSVLPGLGINLGETDMSFRMLHSLAADTSFLLVGLHFALNWGWIVATVKHLVIAPIAKRLHPRPAAQPATVKVRSDK